MQNDLIALLLLVAAAVLLGAIIVAAVRRSRLKRTAQLRENFGPEYERALEEHGDQDRAERELLARRKRRNELDIRFLSEEECDRFSADWASVQQRFVDDPRGAVVQADLLVKDVLRTRGYPMVEFDQRVADLSVEHAGVVEHYRAARRLAVASENGQAETEDLRQAMVHYRALFADLLQSQPVVKREPPPLHAQRLSRA